MRTIHILRSGRTYFIDGILWGDDEEGVRLYLSVTGIAPDEIAKALEGVAQAGRYIIRQGAEATTDRTEQGPRQMACQEVAKRREQLVQGAQRRHRSPRGV